MISLSILVIFSFSLLLLFVNIVEELIKILFRFKFLLFDIIFISCSSLIFSANFLFLFFKLLKFYSVLNSLFFSFRFTINVWLFCNIFSIISWSNKLNSDNIILDKNKFRSVILLFINLNYNFIFNDFIDIFLLKYVV